MLEKLTRDHVCLNLVRRATERLGQDLAAAEAATVATSWAGPHVPATAPARRYVSLDGVLAPTDWDRRDLGLGTAYGTTGHPAPGPPEEVVRRTHDASFVALVDGPEPFGQRLWCDATRRREDLAVAVRGVGLRAGFGTAVHNSTSAIRSPTIPSGEPSRREGDLCSGLLP